MRVDIFSCLLAFILGCNVTAEILHEIVEEKTSAILRCPHSVEGNVIWSRESHGNKTDILTVNRGGDLKHIHDPGKLYSSLADKSLDIRRVTISDSGRYLCNNEPAVELTVIPSVTPYLWQMCVRTVIGILYLIIMISITVTTWRKVCKKMRVNIFSCLLAFILGCNVTAAIIQRVVEENGIVFMPCPDSVEGTVTWSRERNGNKIEILTCDGEQDKRHIHDPERRYRSLAKRLLYITRVIISDTGRYFCNDEPAMELMVNPAGGNKTPMTTSATTTPTAAATTETATPYLWQMCVRTVIGILYLIIMISITVTTWRKAQQITARHNRNRK
ncbi:hypothetical protein ABVT39_012113 [Epinephelus coioides]